MNKAVAEAGGKVLLVSQFTLYGDVRRGKRPHSTMLRRPRKRARCTNILSIAFVLPGWSAKPENFRR